MWGADCVDKDELINELRNELLAAHLVCNSLKRTVRAERLRREEAEARQPNAKQPNAKRLVAQTRKNKNRNAASPPNAKRLAEPNLDAIVLTASYEREAHLNARVAELEKQLSAYEARERAAQEKIRYLEQEVQHATTLHNNTDTAIQFLKTQLGIARSVIQARGV